MSATPDSLPPLDASTNIRSATVDTAARWIVRARQILLEQRHADLVAQIPSAADTRQRLLMRSRCTLDVSAGVMMQRTVEQEG